ncbi:MAG: bifunctional histidinol-phosphatase/imidazoleglycerol-phosphate dehydratase HisB [Flavobacteriales bacterium]
MKKALFIDRDGTIIKEPPVTYQIDKPELLEFLPGAISALARIARQTDYELVMVTNQDGLGTEKYPRETFELIQKIMLAVLESEGVKFKAIHVDDSFLEDNKPTRKPGLGMLGQYLTGEYDLKNSYVIGDRLTDMQLAKNLGAQAIFIRNYDDPTGSESEIQLITDSWASIADLLTSAKRVGKVVRTTKETDIQIEVVLDSVAPSTISTGLNFFDHMLEQIARHGLMHLNIQVKGDLQVDEHHTVEDTGIALGEAIRLALGDKAGIERYGFCLPMDDCLAQVSLDFGGRAWIVWEADFKREKIGDMPTEMFFHFFKSFSDAARCNLNIQADGQNEHHKIEGIFKAFAKAIKMAARRDAEFKQLPSTKGVIA